MDDRNHTAIDPRTILDAVARQSRPLDDPAANYPLAEAAHLARGEGAQQRTGR